MKTKNLALTAIALAALSLSASPVFAEDAPKAAPAGDVGHDGQPPKEGKKSVDREKRGKEMFDKTDTDKDGFISREEMDASQKERMDEMFAISDTNKDGKLSPEELKAGREAMREKFKAKYKGEHRGGPEDGKSTEKTGDKPAEPKAAE